jgi:hypothetical protein
LFKVGGIDAPCDPAQMVDLSVGEKLLPVQQQSEAVR